METVCVCFDTIKPNPFGVGFDTRSPSPDGVEILRHNSKTTIHRIVNRTNFAQLQNVQGAWLMCRWTEKKRLKLYRPNARTTPRQLKCHTETEMPWATLSTGRDSSSYLQVCFAHSTDTFFKKLYVHLEICSLIIHWIEISKSKN